MGETASFKTAKKKKIVVRRSYNRLIPPELNF